MRANRLAIAAAALALSIPGCGAPLHRALVPDSVPEVRVTTTRLASPTPDTYAWLMRWEGSSSAGKVARYLCAIDPQSVDVVDDSWTSTTATERTLTFPVAGATTARAAHVFAVVAVDEHGARSKSRALAITQDNLPPSVFITQPIPNPAFGLYLPSPVRFQWDGNDPDGQSTTKPVRYTYRLFGRINPDFPAIADFITFATLHPDSLRKLYAPTFPGWTSVSGETTSAGFRLPTQMEYLFAITGFDEVGDYDPIFSTSKNMLRFAVAPPGLGGPVIRMFNQFFDYTYPYGGWINIPSRYFPVEILSDQPVTLNWNGIPQPGADIQWYRWVLDPADLFDETPRTDEMTDVHHWSARSRLITSATIGPLDPLPRRPHLFYIEAQDNNGLRSLGIVALSVIAASASPKELLIVDDTRLAPDQRSSPGGPIEGPIGPWPMAAELDTFLYARGGFPWKARAPGTLSSSGIFNGYDYDTVGTRGLLNDVSLSVLARYHHVVWQIDPVGATYTSQPTDPVSPISALRLMSSPGHMSSLAAFVGRGGKAWLLGGGGVVATLGPYNNPNNGLSTFSRDFGELREGRLMFDVAHWREEITILPATRANKFAPGQTFGLGDNRPGRGWPPNPPLPTPPAPPDYSILPLNMLPKGGATDPLPPGRESDPGNFYVGIYTAEYISQPSFVFEDYDDSENEQIYSTLDTLYVTRGGSAPRDKPIMTYYHGRECQPFVFSGFNIWYWRRPDCIALVDFVLGSVWGLPRDPAAPRGPLAPASARRAAQ